MMRRSPPRSGAEALSAGERSAVRRLISHIRREVPAELVQATLFGSRARGEARPDSDVDVLLVFRRLPWDREPQASISEEIAEDVAARSGVPVTVWSVSLSDLDRGARTPMLVDALEDSLPLWCPRRPIPSLPFTPDDAVRCTGALLDRVEEGERELEEHLAAGDAGAAAKRVRDDLVRMCTALELLRGVTRTRRGESPRRVLRAENGTLPPPARRALAWAAASFGTDGRDSEAPVRIPLDPEAALRTVGLLRRLVRQRRGALARALDGSRPFSGHPTCTPWEELDPHISMHRPGRIR